MAPRPPRSLASPTTSPAYAQGAVAAVRPQNTIADYKRRFEKTYPKAKPKVAPKVAPKVNTGTAEDNEYADLMNKYKSDLDKQRTAAANLFAKNKGALEADRNTTRESITKQRGADLDDIAQSYAARGIGRTSGIYQQAGADYETSVAERLKNTDKTFDQQIKNAADNQNETVGEIDAAYKESLAEAASRKTAANVEAKKALPAPPKLKERPKHLPKPIVPNKKAPKYQLVDSKGKGR